MKQIKKLKTRKKPTINNYEKPSLNFKLNKKAKFWLIYIAVALIGIIISIFTVGIEFGLAYFVIMAPFLMVARTLDHRSSKRSKKKLLKTIVLIVLLIGIIGIIAVGGFFAYIIYLGDQKYDVEKLVNTESTIIYDKDNKVITTIGKEKREKLTYDEIPNVLVDAVVATEDSRFFQHNGFDALRFLKASIGQVVSGSGAGGASTLTMQVSKNAFTSVDATITRKFTDIYISIFKLEQDYSKEQIIEFYMNTPFLGSQSYGVEQASQTYFGKSVTQLNLAEASIIAGLFQAPSSYDPYVYPENAQERRSTVLYLMQKHGYITEQERKIANAIPVESLLKSSNDTSGAHEHQSYIDTVIDEVEQKTGLDPYVVPMTIYTNMDRKAQTGINNIMNGKTYKWRNSYVQAGIAAVETTSGKILAVGAGRNKTGARTYNYATDIKRQIGSTAKPLFDYGPAIEYNNISTGTTVVDSPYTYSGGGKITNFDGRYKGVMTVRDALAGSRNVPALKVFQKVDQKNIIKFVTSLGITPEIDAYGGIHEAHAIGGFNGASPLEMAAAYAAFANGGYYYEPYAVNKIVLRATDETMTFSSEGERVMSDATAYMITDILYYGVNSGKIGINRVSGIALAGKTGTTDFSSKTKKEYKMSSGAINDAWIIGYSPDVSIGMWYGYKEFYDSKTKKVHYVTMNQAGVDRKAIFKLASQAVMPKSGKKWTMPSSVTKVAIEFGTDPLKLPSANTPSSKIKYELFKKGTEPTERSSSYVSLSNVTNLAINVESGKVNLSWSAATQPTLSDTEKETNGDFGYEIYKDGSYVGFTTSTEYSYSPSSVYGTYKVVTAYKNFKTNRSSGVTVTHGTTANISLQLNPNRESETLAIGTTYQESSKPVIVLENGNDITNSATISKVIKTSSGATINSIPSDSASTYTITYTVKYQGITKTISKRIIYN